MPPACRLLLGHGLTCFACRLDSHSRQSPRRRLLAKAVLVLPTRCRQWHRPPQGTALLSWRQPQSLCISLSHSCLLGRRRPHRPSSWQQQQMWGQQLEGPRQAGTAMLETQKPSCLQLLSLGRQAQEWCRTAQRLGPLLTVSQLLVGCSSLCWLCSPSRASVAGAHG